MPTNQLGALKQRTSEVRTAFDSLARLERSALQLAHGGGMNAHAIASALGEEPATVRKALRDALLYLGASR